MQDPAVTVEVRRDGPIVITGPVVVRDGGAEVVESRVFLCRCGASSTKPRCDGTHKRIAFTAPGTPPPPRQP